MEQTDRDILSKQMGVPSSMKRPVNLGSGGREK